MAGIKQAVRESIYERDGWECRYCGRPVVRWTLNRDHEATLDHVVPRADGGSNYHHNLVTACWPCNQAKADLGPLRFQSEAA